MWNLLSVALVFLLLSACTATGVAPQPSTNRASTTWECTAIDPAAKQLPDNPCFRVLLSSENQLTLQWRVVNSQPQVYIYDDFGAAYDDIGFFQAHCQSQPGNICSTSLKVTTGGFRRWVIEVSQLGGRRVYVPASIIITPPFPPLEVSGGGFVDMLAPTSRNISWRADPRNTPLDQSLQSAWIEIKPPGSEYWNLKQQLPRSGPEANFTVPASAISAPGGIAYQVRDCHLPKGSIRKFCSQPIATSFYTGADHFTDPTPLYAKADNDLTISFSTRSGDIRRLSSKTLIPLRNGRTFLETRESSISIAADLLTPGTHTVELRSCLSLSEKCSPPQKIQILIGATVAWEMDRSYTDDFLPGVAYATLGAGDPLDITYDSSGGIWVINEFSNSIEHVTPASIVETFTVPLARVLRKKEASAEAENSFNWKTARKKRQQITSLEPVKPFSWNAGTDWNNEQPTTISSLGERATQVGSKLWFTQGGSQRESHNIGNHSRVISFDPALPDSPDTPYDDRLCVYNIPTDDTKRLGNNQVNGLTATTNRIWIGETRGFFSRQPSAISSFIADPNSCENLLDFDNPEALANQSLQYCNPGKTPEQDGCIEKYTLNDLPKGIKVVHLATDPVDNSVWFVDARGKYLGNLDSSRKKVFEYYPIPEQTKGRVLGGFPWGLRVENDSVYFGEYSSRHIVRFDKATSTFSVIKVPFTAYQGGLHSIDIDTRSDRLWFTLTNEAEVTLDKAASTIGYIDLASWREHSADPLHSGPVNGVIYKGLIEIAASNIYPGQHQAFRGIAVDPVSGKIALATALRRQFTELTPNAGFWPRQ